MNRNRNIELSKCGVCSGIKLAGNCVNVKCPMYSLTKDRKKIMLQGIAATSFIVGFNARERANNEKKKSENEKNIEQDKYWQAVSNIGAQRQNGSNP